MTPDPDAKVAAQRAKAQMALKAAGDLLLDFHRSRLDGALAEPHDAEELTAQRKTFATLLDEAITNSPTVAQQPDYWLARAALAFEESRYSHALLCADAALNLPCMDGGPLPPGFTLDEEGRLAHRTNAHYWMALANLTLYECTKNDAVPAYVYLRRADRHVAALRTLAPAHAQLADLEAKLAEY
jgi:hypothetical protein